MHVKLTYWRPFIPDVPVDTELQDWILLGAFTTDERVCEAIQHYMDQTLKLDGETAQIEAGYRQEHFEGSVRWQL